MAVAQPPQKPPAAPAKPAAPAGRSLAIVGGDIYTVTRELIRGGTVLVRDGKIDQVGQDLTIPADVPRIDASGKFVTPGFVAISASRIGIGGSTGAGNRIADALDPFDRLMLFALGSGITTACVSAGGGFPRGFNPPTGDAPGESGPTNHAVLKLTYGELDRMLVREDPFYMTRASSLSGPLNRFNWRDNLTKAKKYLADSAQAERDRAAGKTARPVARPVSDELVKLVRGEVALRTDAETADEIRDLLALSREFGYRLVLEGVPEAWRVAEELGEAQVPVIVTPRRRAAPAPGREESSGSWIETPRVLERAGVPFAVTPLSNSVSLDGIAGRDLTSLAFEAAFAVRGGASERTALASVTIVPARLLGLAERIGSIEPGKDADLLILDGHPLDFRTYVTTAIIQGKVYYERGRERIYPVFERRP
jgi:hypothetical protein